MTNNVDPDQTAAIGAVCSGSMLFASILVRQLFAAKDFSRRHFQMHFFLDALRVNFNWSICKQGRTPSISITLFFLYPIKRNLGIFS